MKAAPSRLLQRGTVLLGLAVSALVLASCSSSVPTASKKPTRSKEYFAESEYGVKASPRVTTQRSNLPRGGGRDQTGKPYKVKGRWYHPKEDPSYRNSGLASWYGDAFHGRLTANGEIYDMTHLTAAHPTMPLPSYARVTNSKNGSSVIVRVNDRGPFAHGRVIDLSRRAAEILDYTHHGLAKVDVEYLGRAPLHGQDDQFLIASYRPGGGAPNPSDGMPTGVMIAMNGPTPTHATAAPAFPGQPHGNASTLSAPNPGTDLVLPEFGPIVPERPAVGMAGRTDTRSWTPALAYADERVKRAAQAVNAFAENRMEPAGLLDALNKRYSSAAEQARTVEEYVAVATYPDQAQAGAMAKLLASAGRPVIETDYSGDEFVLRLLPDGRLRLDDMLRAAWAAGAQDAMTVRE